MGALEPGDGEETEADLAGDDKTGHESVDSIDSEFQDAPREQEDEDDEQEDEGFGAERELCQDDSCVGIINQDGNCGDCGRAASIAGTQGKPRSKRESAGQGGPVDFMHRSLCPDGTCVGLVGPDGRCKECGLVGDQALTDPRLRGLRTPAVEDSDDENSTGSAAKHAPPPSPGGGIEVMATPEEFADRQLCSDGSCIGVIGPEGTCKECGSAP